MLTFQQYVSYHVHITASVTRPPYWEVEGMLGEFGGTAAKPVTAVQDCVSTLMSMKSLNICIFIRISSPVCSNKNPDLFNGKSGQFQAVFVKNRTGVFNKAFGRLQPFLWRPNQIIQAKT